MIVADTDVLSALAKIGRLPLLFDLFRTTAFSITPGVFQALAYSFNVGRPYAPALFGLIDTDQIRIAFLTPAEVTLRDTLSVTLGIGERESIAVARACRGPTPGGCPFRSQVGGTPSAAHPPRVRDVEFPDVVPAQL